jgi:hypothetical protein
VFHGRGRLDGVLREIEEDHEVLDHAHRLVERTVAIVGRISVLLKKIVFQQFGNFQSDLVALGQRGFADQLNDFC